MSFAFVMAFFGFVAGTLGLALFLLWQVAAFFWWYYWDREARRDGR